MTNLQASRVLRVEALIAGATVATVYFVQSLSSVMQVGAFNDDGVYVVLGKAIAEGRGYLSIHLVGAPVHPKFPPVFPLILALFWKLTGSVQGVQSLVSIVHPIIIGIAAGFLWWVGRTTFNVSRALLAVFVMTMFFFDAAIQYYTIPLSEPWFILGSSITIYCWARAEDARDVVRIRWVAAAAFAAAITMLVRSQGVALLPALAYALSRAKFRNRDRIVATLVALAPPAMWYTYHAALLAHGPRSNLPDDITYDTWMRLGVSLNSILAGFAQNIVWYVEQFGSYFAASVTGIAIATVLFAAMVIACVAIVKRAPIVAIPVLVGLVIVLLWPFAQDRLLLSVLPFAGLGLAIALQPLVDRLNERPALITKVVAGALVIAFLMVQSSIRSTNVTSFASGQFPPTYSPGFMLLVNSRFIAWASSWVRANTPPDARVMIDGHAGIYLYSGRETMAAKPSESRMQQSVFQKPGHYLASHILTDSLSNLIVGPPNDGLMRDMATIRTRCPLVLSALAAPRKDSLSIMLIHRDAPCLEKLAE